MENIEISPVAKKPPKHFADLSPEDRAIAVAELGEPAFRAKQLANHYFGRHSENPQEWSDISSESAEKLAAALFPTLLSPVRSITCDGGATRKDLWKLHDGVMVESVLMRYPDRATLCISSQAGCGMGCPFCATGQAGLTRNLSAAEITAQVFAASRAMESGEMGEPMRLSNIVFMGMGEPMANYNAVLRTIRNITAPTPDGFGISARSVTLSTVGLVSGIEKLSNKMLDEANSILNKISNLEVARDRIESRLKYKQFDKDDIPKAKAALKIYKDHIRLLKRQLVQVKKYIK